MHTLQRTLAVAVVSGVFALGLCGCGAGGAGDNSVLKETSLELAGEQTFDVVTFGTYEQDGDESDGAEPIEWYVLEEQDGQSLLISAKVLDAVAYDTSDAENAWYMDTTRPKTDVDWEDCTLRAWANDEFLNTAFSSDEQSNMRTRSNSDTKSNATRQASDTDDSSVHAVATTEDEVFLLSVAEARSYFDNQAARVAWPTEYALQKGVYTGITTDSSGAVDEDASGTCAWWLRSHGYYSGYESLVDDAGYIHGAGQRMDGEMHDAGEHGTEGGMSELGGNYGFRPCIVVDSSALS